MDADDYLTIPPAYADALGGLRWSAACDAVELGGGRTLAVVEQLALVLEGVFASHPAVPHFAHVLHVLKLAVRGGTDAASPLSRLHEAFQSAAGPGSSRNLGVLFAHLCRDLPHVAAPPKAAAISLDLKRRVLFPAEPDPRRAEKPPLGPTEFERRLADVLYDCDVPTLCHWIRHGAPSAERAGRRLVEPLRDPPRRVEPLSAVFRRRPRLAAAVALASALDAALALPPRRRRPDAIPQGGYAGVVTRGDPERLLLSQFALDSLDFVRRFAEHELLYFRREEPHRGDRPVRLVVLDQGVRTWGGVRLALAAAVVALLGKDRKRAGPLRLAVTSVDRPPVDPADVPPEALADLLEASDLSPHPADRLAAALADAGDPGPRDVILLTHPRALGEPAVRVVARGRRATDRLFALSVDDGGRAELGEWRPGGVVRVRSFRVDLTAGEPKVEPGASATASAVAGWRPWTGDVEPIHYPFRPGLLGPPQALAFDAAGEHVAVLGPRGMLHVAKLDGSAPEVLPRAMYKGVLLATADTVVGVEGGFVVGGETRSVPGSFQLDSSKSPLATALLSMAIAAHYDLARRTVRVFALTMAGNRPREWYSFPDLHSVAVKTAGRCRAVDLASDGKFPPDGPERDADSRAWQAHHRAMALQVPPPNVSVHPIMSAHKLSGPWVGIVDGAVVVENVDPPWTPFTPLSDGRRLLEGVTLTNRTQLAGQTLAIEVTGAVGGRPDLLLFRGPNGRLHGRFDGSELSSPVFQLSADGRWLARQVRLRSVWVHATDRGEQSVRYLHAAKTHPTLAVELERSWIKVMIGKTVHTFTLDTAVMQHACVRDQVRHPARRTNVAAAMSSGFGYDDERYVVAASRAPWIAVVDSWGQVLLLDVLGRTVAHVLVRRSEAAIVLPDGTRWGAAALLGGPATPGAPEAIGRALRAAAGGGP